MCYSIEFKLSDSGIGWWTSGGSIKLSGKWHAKFTELITVRDKGWLNADATDIKMNISASVYQLDGQPQVKIGECRVEIRKLDVETPPKPTPISLPISYAGSHPGMLTSWLSVAVPNCLVESAHRNQLVKLLVSKTTVPVAAPYLKTSCGFLGICIGKFFPKLKSEYPNAYVDLFFHTHDVPLFTMSQTDGVVLNMSLAVDFFINPYLKTKEATRIVVDTTSEVEPYLSQSIIHGRLLNSTISAREDFSYIGNVSETFLHTFSSILSMTAREAVKTVLKVGIPIPSYDNVTLADSSQIEIFDQYLRANIDFEYI
uniref:BPI2 domain-containing protein n=2 Tax=Caenorhabditis japonica TaxID=281687 RepID=A0A8R1HPK2_CAEJA